jgi:hypothetical protein
VSSGVVVILEEPQANDVALGLEEHHDRELRLELVERLGQAGRRRLADVDRRRDPELDVPLAGELAQRVDGLGLAFTKSNASRMMTSGSK